MSGSPSVVVTGDLVLDHHLYEGDRAAFHERSSRGTHLLEEIGGSLLTHRLIQAAFNESFAEEIRRWRQAVKEAKKKQTAAPPPPAQLISTFGLRLPTVRRWPEQLVGYASWSPQSAPGKKDSFWRVSRASGYGSPRTIRKPHDGRPSEDSILRAGKTLSGDAGILVLDDAGDLFRRQDHAPLWRLPPEAPALPEHIVLKLAGPIGKGDLWDRLMGSEPQKRLIVVLSARLLRRSTIRLSRGLSWERTAEHLRSAITENPDLRPLLEARDVIVSFDGDGAVWIDNSVPDRPSASLVFDPEHVEGEWTTASRVSGEVFGYQACIAAAVAFTLATKRGSAPADLNAAIERGLAAARDLRLHGHGMAVSEKGVFTQGGGFPAERLARVIVHPVHRFARTALPWANAVPASWSILASAHGSGSSRQPLYGFARQLTIRGESVLNHVPHLRIGQLLAVGRDEIEALRGLKRILEAYRSHGSGKKPLSIGVFGKPGSGKSFAVKQLAIGIFGSPDKKEYEGWLEFNLSQFAGPVDLIGALHQVRDRALQGLIPVVFWDEFDARQHWWLQYLLAPMQDGRFQEGQGTHPIGKCVFIFAGGVAQNLETFGPPPGQSDTAFTAAKGPDFKSRLDGYFNVIGPNPEEQVDDIFFPVRRALFVRNFLGCKPGDELHIDSGLLTALLEIPAYRHGARSVEKVLEPLTAARNLAPKSPLRRSQLPAPNQLKLHVNDDEFHALCARDVPVMTDDVIAQIARAIHETWRTIAQTQGWKPRYDMPYDDLPPDVKRSNEAAARRIPDILALIGLHIVKGLTTPDEEAAITKQLARHLGALAEEEHNGWMANAEAEGWRFAEVRDDDKRLHDCLRPFHELREKDKDKDRETVSHYPDFLRGAGFKIVAS